MEHEQGKIVPDHENKSTQNNINDSMDDINLEPGLKPQTMMQIDSHNLTDNLVCAILVIVTTLVTLIASLTGPQQYRTKSQIFPIHNLDESNPTQILEIESSINEITPFNRFLSLEIDCRREDTSIELISKLNISLNISVLTEKLGNNVKSIVYQNLLSEYPVIYQKDSIESQKVSLYFDKMLQNKDYHSDLVLSGKDLISTTKYVELYWKFGDKMVTWAVIIVKSLYLTIILILFFLYTKTAIQKKFFMLTIEQKFTFVLIFLCLLTDNPTTDINFPGTNLIFLIFTSIFDTIFKMFVSYYLIKLYQSVKCQSVPIDYPIEIVITIVFYILILVDISISLISSIDTFKTQLLLKSSEIKCVSNACELSISFLVLLVMLKTSLTLDETEFFRFAAYSIHAFLMFFITIPVKIIQSKTELSYIPMLMEHTGYNLFVITMAYFHWPYQILKDTSYQDSTIQEKKLNIEVDGATSESDQEMPKFSDDFNSD
ncbi:hypothetical protein TRFO_35422 [Tritrichomonas foetus]|uniref:Wntless-like transmembrane domain-containing protein n=1 Tax=Tritrichomonas foetus TaxID=1144522 RepID=A0A1J4JGA7_9EUKA|nr:hypothetical protein TRFO_35422 [Tritrichomonas foetus]|eukprot:OHS98222.1 hypothetical protein TRFO_35422 [Tritrichomonas foetus]